MGTFNEFIYSTALIVIGGVASRFVIASTSLSNVSAGFQNILTVIFTAVFFFVAISIWGITSDLIRNANSTREKDDP